MALPHRFAVGLVQAMILAVAAGCASIPNKPARAARSSYGCMQAVRDKVPDGIPDKRAHCLAAGGIARDCSIGEAYMAGAGKEIRDFFGGGDAEWGDWHADRVGIRCARESADDDALTACCRRQGY